MQQIVRRMIYFAKSMCLLAAGFTAAADAPALAANSPPADRRVYRLDCGRLDFADMAGVSDTDDYAGKAGTMAVPCFLIKHGSDWMLWDLGLGDEIAKIPRGIDRYGFHWTVAHTLRSQLAALGLKPSDITRIGLSHTHGDHLGNIGLFPNATVYVSPTDLKWGQEVPPPPTVNPLTMRTLLRSKIMPVPFDQDIFGDGSVRMLRAPGHSPGHHVLVIRLPKTGVVILAGDLWHFRSDYDKSLMTAVNDSRAETLASMARIRTLADRWKARIVIQHDPTDYAKLPEPPNFLN